MIRNDQVGIHEPKPLTHFPSFQVFPNIFPSSLPNLFQCPGFVHPFFLTPCPALSTHCLLMWMIIWRLPLRNRRPIAIGISIMTYKFHRTFSSWYIMGTKSQSLRNPLSLSPWQCICIWHPMGFRWNERDTTIFTSSYKNAMHQSNTLSASLVAKR